MVNNLLLLLIGISYIENLSKIQVLRGEISKLERSRSNPSLKLRDLTQIRKKYFVKKKGLNVVIEELKQRVVAKAEKLRR